MKALRVEMVDVQPMTMKKAIESGYGCIFQEPDDGIRDGYLVTSSNGESCWYSKAIFLEEFYELSHENDGTKILKEDVEHFITDVDTITVGEKTTVVNAHTLTGFDTVKHSSCVDPKNYNEELGKKYAMEEVINSLWSHLGFVLQWAKFGLKRK